MGVYTIKELEKLSGIKAHTIRIWERRYNILHPDRTESNIRYYDDSELRKLINISILNRNGIKISKLASLTNEQICEKVLALSLNSNEHTDVIESLIKVMVDMDEANFSKVFTNAIRRFGYEVTITEIIFPFLQRVGILWQTGSVIPAQEHFVSNLVRQKLLVALDALEPFEKPWTRKFLLFLPEGQYHELSLIFLNYYLRKNNHQVVYLGQSVPYYDILRAIDITKPDIAVFSVAGTMPPDEQSAYVNRLSKDAQGVSVWFGFGLEGAEILEYELPDNVFLIQNPETFRHRLAEIRNS